MKQIKTYTVTIYMAGDIQDAKRVIGKLFYARKACATVTPTTFVYTGGHEEGVAIRFVNYPKRPSTHDAMLLLATEIAECLMAELNQKTALLVAPDKTVELTKEPPGALGKTPN